MANVHDRKQLDAQLRRAGSQWREEDLDEILSLLDKDYTKPQEPEPRETVPPLTAEEPEETLDGLQALLDKDYTKEPQPEEEPEEGYIPAEPPRAGIGEQADFDEAPQKTVKGWVPILLRLVAVAEIVALVLLVLWWLRWSR